MNRRVSKTFTRTQEAEGEGEYETDANTLALYHFNETSGKVLDSSGNNNHGRAPHHIERGVDGLWDTKALSFKGAPVDVPKSKSLDNVKLKFTNNFSRNNLTLYL